MSQGLTCDDCLSGLHRGRCVRRVECACSVCTKSVTPAVARMRADRTEKARKAEQAKVYRRPGVVSKTGDYVPVTDELCHAAAQLIAENPQRTFTSVAAELNVNRPNLHRALAHRGLR